MRNVWNVLVGIDKVELHLKNSLYKLFKFAAELVVGVDGVNLYVGFVVKK